MIEVLKPGLQTTVQDGGRPGHLGQGIPPGGPQDHYSMKAASRLVGNTPPPPPLSLGDPGHAGLEAALLGPTVRFERDAVIAVTGAETRAKLDGEPFPLWEAVAVKAGQVLDMGTPTKGARNYLAIAGGIEVPIDLGSRSTYLVGARGGHEGRPLKAGDRLPLGEPQSNGDIVGRRLRADLMPVLERPQPIRVVMGPQDHMFTDEAIEVFLTQEFKLTAQANRMGFRFLGPELKLKPKPEYLLRDGGNGAADIVDDTTPMGGIQVPGGVEMIIMGVEVPSAGGYAKIGVVITADMSRVGQLRPAESIRYQAVTHDEAVQIGIDQSHSLDGDVFEGGS
jgi:biotin-dependent carboxylase-like uncharacterized protein